jgi:hypothetical protein
MLELTAKPLHSGPACHLSLRGALATKQSPKVSEEIASLPPVARNDIDHHRGERAEDAAGA